MAKVFLKKTRETRVRSGHPWVFASDVERAEDAQPGDVVEVYSSKNVFFGRAMYNPNSQITLRMLTRDETPVDDEFFYNRVKTAWEYRKTFCDPDKLCTKCLGFNMTSFNLSFIILVCALHRCHVECCSSFPVFASSR